MKLLAGIFSVMLMFAVIMAVDLGITLGVLQLTQSGIIALVAGVMILIVAGALLWNRALNKVVAEKNRKCEM